MDYFLRSKKYQEAFKNYSKNFGLIFLEFFKWQNFLMLINALFMVYIEYVKTD